MAAPRFEGQVAIVTGGADGLGKGISLRLLSEGAFVVLFDVNEKLMGEALAEFSSKGLTKASASRVDVSNEANVKEEIDKVAAQHGRLDVMINCAGIVGTIFNVLR
jgi:NAD(P)-dependent dehydrogenase (short-subunit alcohol dehydrogenase family)